MGNCQTASTKMVTEEGSLDALHNRYVESAEEAERKASLAEAEAARLEWEAGSAEDGPYETAERDHLNFIPEEVSDFCRWRKRQITQMRQRVCKPGRGSKGSWTS